MIRLRRDTKFVMVLAVVLISLFLGYERSNLKNALFPKPVKANTKEVEKIFQNLGNARKVTIRYDVTNKEDAFQKINEIIFSEEVKIKYSEMKDDIVLNILELPAAKFESILMKLRAIKGLSVENIQTGLKSVADESITASIKNNEMTKRRIQELIDKTTSSESIKRLKQELEETQTKIDSLKNMISATSHFNDYDLFFISILRNPNASADLKKASLDFAVTTFTVMIILIISLAIFYFIYIGLTSVMNTMGIKSSRRGSSNYNTYSYGKRSYGRKVKRIYKNPDGTRRVETDNK